MSHAVPILCDISLCPLLDYGIPSYISLLRELTGSFIKALQYETPSDPEESKAGVWFGFISRDAILLQNGHWSCADFENVQVIWSQ